MLNFEIMKVMASLKLSKYITNNQEIINRKFVGACRRGDLEIIKLLVTCPQILFKPQLISLSEDAFKAASYSGNLELFKFLEILYKNNNISIKLPLLDMACCYAKHELIGYISKYYEPENIKRAFNYLLINDKLETFLHLSFVTGTEFTQKELEDFFKKVVDKLFGSSEKFLFWMLVEKSLFIGDELRKWLYAQPKNINVIKAIGMLETIEVKNNMEKSLGDKATVKTKSKI